MTETGVLSRQERQVQGAFDFEHRRFEAARYLRISPALVEDWLADVRLPAEYFAGKRVLDVGCGSGRWTYAMASLGAQVTAVDFCDGAVEMTREVTRNVKQVQVLKASLWNLPFQAGQFDFAVSWGVLHHTRNTAEAFRTIAPLVRTGGHLHVMVYEQRSPLKVAGTELLRTFLRRLPAETRYRLCGRLVIRNRLLFHLVRGFIACVPKEHLTDRLDAETAQFGLYDWYSPQYNHLHRVDEVRGWFTACGYGDVQVTTPIKYHRRLDVLRFGQCGGSISMRGRKSEMASVEQR
jgi:2-polyprenyl-3-methyl-5-hydroxy-6-metoxy-1,4-benzoquinol methylase